MSQAQPSSTQPSSTQAKRKLWRRGALVAVLATLAVGLLGCSTVSYYWQSAAGHASLLWSARPVDDWLADPQTPPALRERLQLAQRIRQFAVHTLHEPDNASYHRYADLKRRAVTWSVTAAPIDSLQLKTWCYPVLGCAGYRGYFDEQAANSLAEQLQRQEHLETYVFAVPAYSTLGWFNWAGGDPLLSTFVGFPEGELARMIFHELAHQVVFVKDDTPFNESFATAVERLGVTRWLAEQGSAKARADYAALDARRHDFARLTLQTRVALQAVYQQRPGVGQPEAEAKLLADKAAVMQRFRQDYAQLKARWAEQGQAFDGYDRWVAQANNASFAIQAAYDGWVPAFEALFRQEDQDWPRFFAAVQTLAELPPAQRQARLQALTPAAEAAAQPAPAQAAKPSHS